MPARFNIKMQRMILLALIPALSVITLITGIWLYRSLYHVIIEGFDRKLFALATTTAAFIDGEKLLSVIEPYQVHGLAYDADQERLYGVDTLRSALVHIDPELGGAVEIGPIGFEGIADLAFAPERRVLYGVCNDTSQLIRIAPDSGAGEALMPVHETLQGLTWDGQRLLGSGEALVAIRPDTKEVRRLVPFPDDVAADITGLAFDVASDTLYGLRGETGLLVTIDPVRGSIEEVGPLIPDGQAFGEVPYGVEAGELPAYGLTFDTHNDALYASADRLMILDPETGAGALDLWLSRHYCNPAGETFEYFAAPMRAILEDKGVTYLYTFKMGGRKDIVYIVDATPGEDWAPIGYEEDLPPQNVDGLERAVEEGIPFISDVLYFELWGLLKVAAAPIYDDAGAVRALAGVDINIDLIRTKTRVALFQVLGFGVLSLILAGMVSLWVTRRLIRPINQLKNSALSIAAGQYRDTLEVDDPRELRELSHSLNGIGETLRTTVNDMTATSEQMEMSRRKTELARSVPNQLPDHAPVDGECIAIRWLFNRPHCADASGCLSRDPLVLQWIGGSQKDTLPAVKQRSDLGLALAACLRQMTDPSEIQEQLDTLYPDEVLAYVICDIQRHTLRILARRPMTLCRIQTDTAPAKFVLEPGIETLSLNDGETILVLSTDPDGHWIDEIAALRLSDREVRHASHAAERVRDLLHSRSRELRTPRFGLLTAFTRSDAP